MDRFSKDIGSHKIQCIRPKPLHEVSAMPARLDHSEHRGDVVQMRARWPYREHRTAAVLTMPSRSNRASNRASVVEMPSRLEGTSETQESHTVAEQRRPTGAAQGLSDGLRMTLVALFALLGWPGPTHGKDPGAAAARPFKLELLNVISSLRIPAVSLAEQKAAREGVLALPCADDPAVVRAA